MTGRTHPVVLLSKNRPLVGRHRELAALCSAVAAAIAGRGSLTAIGGEARISQATLTESALALTSDQGILARQFQHPHRRQPLRETGNDLGAIQDGLRAALALSRLTVIRLAQDVRDRPPIPPNSSAF